MYGHERNRDQRSGDDLARHSGDQCRQVTTAQQEIPEPLPARVRASAMRNGPEYVRLQATYRGRLGVEVGIFVAVDHLRRADRLTQDEEELYFDIEDWFNASLPNPPFYEDGNSVGAITWFKRFASAEMLRRLTPLCDILTKYGVEWVAAESSDPGSVIYEDEFQVGVIPYIRSDPSPAPRGLVLGPTTAGSKRHLGKRARQRP